MGYKRSIAGDLGQQFASGPVIDATIEACRNIASAQGATAVGTLAALAGGPLFWVMLLGGATLAQFFGQKKSDQELHQHFGAIADQLEAIKASADRQEQVIDLLEPLLDHEDWLLARLPGYEKADIADLVVEKLQRFFKDAGITGITDDPGSDFNGVRIYLDKHSELLESLAVGQRQTHANQNEMQEKLDRLLVSEGGSATIDRRFSLPPVLPDFTGRDSELAQLSSGIARGAAISGFRGMGGVGKTALAIRLAHQFKVDFPDAQIVVDLLGTATGSLRPLTHSEAMGVVIRAFHPETQLPESDQEIAAQYMSVLHGKRVLLLFDNALDRAQVEPLCPPTECLMLVTSRASFTLPGLLPINLDVLEEQDAINLLLTLCPRIKGSAGEISKLCGRLPLALRLAGAALTEHDDLTVDDYVSRLQKEGERVKQLDRFETQADRTIAASIALSVVMLAARGESLVEYWESLAVFPAGFRRDGATEVWGLPLDSEDAADALSEIRRLSLVEWDDKTKRYRLHDLVRDYARARVSTDALAAAQRRHAEHYLKVLGAAADHFDRGHDAQLEALRIFDFERGNIESGFEWSRHHAAQNDEAASICSLYPIRGPSLIWLRLRPAEQGHWLEAAASAAERIGDDPRLATLIGNLGVIEQKRGNHDAAEEYHKRSLAINEELGHKEGMANQYGNLSLIARVRGNLDEAENYLKRSLSIFEKYGLKEGMASTYGNLGVIEQKRGNHDAAEEYLKRSLAINEELGRKEGMASDYGNLGFVARKRGEFAEARRLWTRSLELFTEIGARDRIDQVQCVLDALPPEDP